MMEHFLQICVVGYTVDRPCKQCSYRRVQSNGTELTWFSFFWLSDQ